MAKRYFSPLSNIDFNTYGGRFKKGVVNGGVQQTTKGSTFSIYADDVIISTDYTGSYDSLSPGNINLIPTGAVFIGNSVTPPTDTPSNGGYLYASNGSLTYKSSDGSVTAMGIVKAQEVLWGISGAMCKSYEVVIGTTDATKTTVFTYTPPTNVSVSISAAFLIRKSDGTTARWTIQDAVFKNVSGVISAVGTTPTFAYDPSKSDSGTSAWGGWTVEISGANIIVTETVAVSTTAKSMIQVIIEELIP